MSPQRDLNKMELHTLDINLDNFDNLNSSVEAVRRILDKFKQDTKIFGYYLMRYNRTELFLGIKIIFDDLEKKKKTLAEIKEKIKEVQGYQNIKQDNSNGEIKDNLPLICSLSMEFRNKILDLLKRKPNDNEFLHITHYLANPLLLNYIDEERIKKLR